MANEGRRRQFGSIRKRSNGRYQVRYQVAGHRYCAPKTYRTMAEGLTFLATVETDLARDVASAAQGHGDGRVVHRALDRRAREHQGEHAGAVLVEAEQPHRRIRTRPDRAVRPHPRRRPHVVRDASQDVGRARP